MIGFKRLENGSQTRDVQYFYDSFGRRIAKNLNISGVEYTNSYSYMGIQDRILLSKNGNGEETLHVDGQSVDEHMAQLNTSLKTFVSDHLGSIMNTSLTTNSNSYGPFREQQVLLS